MVEKVRYIKDVATWPLILLGPISLCVSKESVTAFVTVKSPCTSKLSIHSYTASDSAIINDPDETDPVALENALYVCAVITTDLVFDSSELYGSNVYSCETQIHRSDILDSIVRRRQKAQVRMPFNALDVLSDRDLTAVVDWGIGE